MNLIFLLAELTMFFVFCSHKFNEIDLEMGLNLKSVLKSYLWTHDRAIWTSLQ